MLKYYGADTDFSLEGRTAVITGDVYKRQDLYFRHF